MVEAVLLSIAAKILLTIASPAFEKGYDVFKVKKGLEALNDTIKSIQATIEEAEADQDHRARLKDWLEKIGDALHEADDLFDEVAADELLKLRTKGNSKLVGEVKVQLSTQNSFFSNYFIAKKVDRIRKRLEGISKDESMPNPVNHPPVPLEQKRRSCTTAVTTPGLLINPESILGRGEDHRAIHDFLFDTNVNHATVPVIAIVGIAGIGKTTVAQLICGDEQVQKQFPKMWWVNVPDTVMGDDILRSIIQSAKGGSYEGVNLRSEIKTLVTKTPDDPWNYLLILDGVREQNLIMWRDIIDLLSGGAQGSSIIVTTRDQSVARAMGAIKTHELSGLSLESSQNLFRRIAFLPGQLPDENRIKVGNQIVDKCANNPLAIKSIAAVLYYKPSVEEWESVRDDPRLQCEGSDADSIMSRLRMSFAYLKPEVKSCFAYCSLFPKGYKIVKQEILYLWIAQGYVNSATPTKSLESIGNDYFNTLLRMYFFEELDKDEYGEIMTYKMHDLYYQLAEDVAGVQRVILTKERVEFHKRTRHLAVGCAMDNDWTIPKSLLFADRLRSSLFIEGGSLSPLVPGKLFTAFKFLRALNLKNLWLSEVSDSVGDLKLLRYLDLSYNVFESLPSSILKLVNLLTLDISHCRHLKALPRDFQMLNNLIVLNAKKCCSLRNTASTVGDLTSLQYFSYFHVGQETTKGISFNKLIRKQQEDRNVCLQLPISLRMLKIENPAMKIPHWDSRRVVNPSQFPNLVKLHIYNSLRIQSLPTFRRLSSLKELKLSYLMQLQYIEENDENESTQNTTTTEFFLGLEDLILESLPSLKGWLRGVEARMSSENIEANQIPPFPRLLNLRVEECLELKSIPLSKCLQTLNLHSVTGELIQQLVNVACSHSLTSLSISDSSSLCFQFESLTKLQCLVLENCSDLKSLYLVEPTELSILEKLQIVNCPNLESYGLNTTTVNWDSFPKLQVLIRDNIQME